MKKSILFLLLLISAFSYKASATHIVGGNIGLRYLRPNTYNLNLTVYFDAVNGNVQAIDDFVQLNVFSIASNSFVQAFVLPLEPSDFTLQFSNPNCTQPAGNPQVTRVLNYQLNVNLIDTAYDDPEGYYVVWERCCRNASISNIVRPGGVGQAFYLEFPPIRANGRPFINSTPAFEPPVGDFACVGQPFNFDFAATDADGDSLTYQLTAPLVGTSDSTLPGQYPNIVPIASGPYRRVTWRNFYSNTVQILGTPPLSIDANGQLYMVPNRVGLFVFAIVCTEYRNGVKIGASHREFQLSVRDCRQNTAPSISITNPSNPSAGSITKGDTITIVAKPGVNQFPINISDGRDSQTLTLTSRGFPTGALALRTTSGTTDTNAPLLTQFDVNPCVLSPQGAIGTVRIIAKDNGCPFAKSDTFDFVLRIVQYKLTRPVASVALDRLADTSLADSTIIISSREGYNFFVSSFDSTQNNLPVGFAISPPNIASLTLVPAGQIGRTTLYRANFKLPCMADTGVRFVVSLFTNTTFCGQSLRDTVQLAFKLFVRDGFPNLFVYDSSGGSFNTRTVNSQDTILLEVDQPSAFRLVGTTSDTSDVLLSANMEPQPNGSLVFTGRSAPSPQEAFLRFRPNCTDASTQYFRLLMESKSVFCQRVNADTLALNFKIADLPSGTVKVPNIVTANGDSINETFQLAEPLPVDNCRGRFQSATIYNRWGKVIYTSTNRQFVWRPNSAQAGTFFYSILDKGRNYRGWVEVVR